MLAGRGIEWGLIGPRETDRLWDRHILNSAAPADPAEGLVGANATVADVGSGAGLPGIVWAIIRPDLHVTMVEPLLRRSEFLTLAVSELELDERTAVLRARAEEMREAVSVDVVTARAVAPLRTLAGWLMPLTNKTGRVIALKGSSVHSEIEASGKQLKSAGARSVQVHTCGESWLEHPVTVAVLERS